MTQSNSDIYCRWNKGTGWELVDEKHFWSFIEQTNPQCLQTDVGFLSFSVEHAGIYIKGCALKIPLDKAPAMEHDLYAFLKSQVEGRQAA